MRNSLNASAIKLRIYFVHIQLLVSDGFTRETDSWYLRNKTYHFNHGFKWKFTCFVVSFKCGIFVLLIWCRALIHLGLVLRFFSAYQKMIESVTFECVQFSQNNVLYVYRDKPAFLSQIFFPIFLETNSFNTVTNISIDNVRDR